MFSKMKNHMFDSKCNLHAKHANLRVVVATSARRMLIGTDVTPPNETRAQMLFCSVFLIFSDSARSGISLEI